MTEDLKVSLDVEVKKAYFTEQYNNIYGFSGGIGVQLHGVPILKRQEEPSDWDKVWLFRFPSNFLTGPYFLRWIGQESNKSEKFPIVTTPRNEEHLRLLQATSKEYEAIDRTQLRYVLSNGTSDRLKRTKTKISKQEYAQLLKLAEKNQFIEGDRNKLHIQSVPRNGFEFITHMFTSRLATTDAFNTSMTAFENGEEFRQLIFEAAVHKLGCMLALTDQITYDAAMQNVPISKDFVPGITEDERKQWQDTWLTSYNEPLPPLRDLYTQAHSVLFSYAKPNDRLLAHLVPLHSLPQLV